MRRSSFRMSLVFLVLAMCELGAAAEEKKLEGAGLLQLTGLNVLCI